MEKKSINMINISAILTSVAFLIESGFAIATSILTNNTNMQDIILSSVIFILSVILLAASSNVKKFETTRKALLPFLCCALALSYMARYHFGSETLLLGAILIFLGIGIIGESKPKTNNNSAEPEK